MTSMESSLTRPALEAAVPGAGGRLDFIDNLRWAMIVLVVTMHAAVTYSHIGSWYYMEDPKPGLLGTVLFAYYQMGLQAFFMGLLFLVAGYFVPGAFERKGASRFLRERFIRLGLPALFYMLVLHPVIVYWLLRDYYRITTPFPTTYLGYLLSFQFVGSSGPMWFTVALFLFCLGYALARRPRSASIPAAGETSLPTHRQVVALALLIALCTFLVRIVQPIGTSILNMQLCFFSQYILLFITGLIAYQRNWLLRLPYAFAMRWFWLALSAGSVFWFAVIAAAVATHTETTVVGGLTWQSAALCLWESFFCLGLCLGLTVLFRDKFKPNARFAKWMAANSFSVYLFHAPLLIAVTLGLHYFAAPKLLKFLLASFLGTVITFAASHWCFRRIWLLRRVL